MVVMYLHAQKSRDELAKEFRDDFGGEQLPRQDNNQQACLAPPHNAAWCSFYASQFGQNQSLRSLSQLFLSHRAHDAFQPRLSPGLVSAVLPCLYRQRSASNSLIFLKPRCAENQRRFQRWLLKSMVHWVRHPRTTFTRCFLFLAH